MFRLIKNEIKSTAHNMMGIYMAALITIGLMVLAQLADIKWLSAISFMVLFFGGVLVFFVTMISVIMNFSRSLYGDEGYLSFTLPVKGGTLLAAKAGVSTLWMVVSYLMWFGMMVGSMAYMTSIMESTASVIKMLEELLPMFFDVPSRGVLIYTAVFSAVSLFLQMFVFISGIFFAITLSNTRPFEGHRALWAILLSFIVLIPAYIVSIILTNNAPLTFVVSADNVGILPISMDAARDMTVDIAGGRIAAGDWRFPFGVAGMLFQLVISALMLYLTAFMMNRKTNVK